MTEQRSFELLDFVLLACQFSFAPEVEEREEAADGDTPPPPAIEIDGARLNILSIGVDDDAAEFVFILETSLDDPPYPFQLSVVTGSRFTIAEPRVTPEDAASTLLFITYPYLRELVASITGRSPYRSVTLPPLTKRPVWGEPAPKE